MASRITPVGERQILGVSVSLSEHETHWKAFLQGLKDRGLRGIKLVTSDDHSGLGAARISVLGSVPWQWPIPLTTECWGLCSKTINADGSSG